ncbi:Deoxyuridine 5'-triphosphate nucleotidohydrolase [Jimgerdemannia flammicorona]|uniref:Deoxyuridine 5'-triphosphate nucleotidohydrolase n=1 Tax=Jimgerdemannia flammicorona TaxID=994334 RepID=A0A433P573_9FUNG|nr:Deoxyuridine 5'-triphosphate nucleotidohydrolase [Jimgerdemannia flammicorona]
MSTPVPVKAGLRKTRRSLTSTLTSTLTPSTPHTKRPRTKRPLGEVNENLSPKRVNNRATHAFSLRVKRLSEHAKLPTRGSAHAAGYDLYSSADTVIPAQGKTIVPTDISIGIPTGCYGRVAPRSGLAYKFFLDTGAGVIDEDYRGPLGVIMFNFSKEDYQVKAGERIAQLILEQIFTPEVVEVDSLEETERGAGGFGSTGKK